MKDGLINKAAISLCVAGLFLLVVLALPAGGAAPAAGEAKAVFAVW